MGKIYKLLVVKNTYELFINKLDLYGQKNNARRVY